jgi:DNA gyrase subunit B
VYLAQPPLYRLKWSNHPHEYAYSDRERDALRRGGQRPGKKLPKEPIQRYKGLGEMNAKSCGRPPWTPTAGSCCR